jgi:ubiquinone/menaquinone biosynthesis methyltransferase
MLRVMPEPVSADAAGNAAHFSMARDDVFARIADRYDLLCDIFSLGIHRLWKSHMARRMAEHADDTVLDVASGTGDIPLRLLRLDRRPRALWVTDICPRMLGLAEAKLAGQGPGVRFAICDAENLRAFADSSLDVYSMSFGMKICDRQKAVSEAFRVLKPAGRFYCLEAAHIPNHALRALYLAYMDWCMPLIGRVAANGDASAYHYLLRGVHRFPDQAAFAAELASAGFVSVRYVNLTFGIVALHEATKPAHSEVSQ